MPMCVLEWGYVPVFIEVKGKACNDHGYERHKDCCGH